MSFDDLLIHDARHLPDGAERRPRSRPPGDTDGDPILDDYAQPTYAPVVRRHGGWADQAADGPRGAAASQAGAAISTHIGYVYPLTGLTTACWIESGGVRYDVTGISDAAGAGHHLALDLVAVT